jgi:hypothetical protein
VQVLNGTSWQTLHETNNLQYFSPASNTKVQIHSNPFVLCRLFVSKTPPHPCPPPPPFLIPLQLLTTSAAFRALGPDHVFLTQLQASPHNFALFLLLC